MAYNDDQPIVQNILYDENGNPVSVVLEGGVYKLEALAKLQAGTEIIGQVGIDPAQKGGLAEEATLQSLDGKDFATETTLATRATESTLAAADTKLSTIDAVLDSIKDTDGIKKITDQLPAGTNEIGKVAQGTKASGTDAWPMALYDANGNAVGVVLDGSIYRLQTESKLIAGDDTVGRFKMTDGTNVVNVADDAGTGRLYALAKLEGVVPVEAAGNSSTTPLGANAEFVGSTDNIQEFAMIHTSVFADQDSAVDGLVFEYSVDGTNFDLQDEFDLTAGDARFYTLPPQAKFFRIRYKNGPTPQGAFRLQTVYKRVYGKTSSYRIIDELSDNEGAELVRSVIAARKTGGDYVNIQATDDARLRVSSLLVAPEDSTPVVRRDVGSVPSNTALDDVYVIPNGQTLTIQQFQGGAASSSGAARVELIERPSTGGTETIISLGYAEGNNFVFETDEEFVGDGSREIVLRRNNIGSSRHMFGRWSGFTRNT